jgi:hypothetical protein
MFQQCLKNRELETANNTKKNDKTNIKISHIQIMFHADNSMFILFSIQIHRLHGNYVYVQESVYTYTANETSQPTNEKKKQEQNQNVFLHSARKEWKLKIKLSSRSAK